MLEGCNIKKKFNLHKKIKHVYFFNQRQNLIKQNIEKGFGNMQQNIYGF